MCGIAGQVSLDGETPISRTDIEKMLSIIAHRGPDGEGHYTSQSVAFGMRRLSIIDLYTGWQPLYNEDKSICCCANAELFNYKELRVMLEVKGHVFSTDSDVEVAVHLYEEYGPDFISQINGMFALVLWDSNQKRLYLYRDRLGQKPLYYTIQNNRFYFASEIKSILCCKNIKRECDLLAMDLLLTYNYVPGEKTSFLNIQKVNPGTYFHIHDGNVENIRYWDLPGTHPPEDEALGSSIAKFQGLFENAVELRLRSDVPLGAFLSGGIDSATVVSIASKYKSDFSTFSIGFPDAQYDELPYAKRVARFFNKQHFYEIVTADFIPMLSEMIWYSDCPHGDVSFLPTLVLSQLAAKHVKVVLTGDGGDELFGGYKKYLPFSDQGIPEEQLYGQYLAESSVFTLSEKQALISPKLKADLDPAAADDLFFDVIKNARSHSDKNDPLNNILYSDIQLLLEGNNLVKPDRMGMACSIEARMPFMDYRIVEFAAKLPSQYKIRDGETKYMLKKYAEAILPQDIVYRPKQMFTVPIGEWFKGNLYEFIEGLLLSERAANRGYFSYESVQNLLLTHRNGTQNNTRKLRVLMMIELWHRIFIDHFYERVPSFSEIM